MPNAKDTAAAVERAFRFAEQLRGQRVTHTCNGLEPTLPAQCVGCLSESHTALYTALREYTDQNETPAQAALLQRAEELGANS